MMVQEALQAVGMTDRQAKIYIAGLKIGGASANDIAQKAKENRVTTYKTLKEMCDLGFSKEYIKGKKIFFDMIKPDEILKNQTKKLENLQEYLPELVGLMGAFGEKPKIKIYEGLENLKSVYNELFDEMETVRIFIGQKEADTGFVQFIHKDFLPNQINTIHTIQIVASPGDHIYTNQTCTIQSHCIDKELFGIANEIIVYGYTKIAICSYKPNNIRAFVIESKTFHNCMAGIFDAVFVSP